MCDYVNYMNGDHLYDAQCQQIRIVVYSFVEIYMWVCWISLYRLISSHPSTNKRARLSRVFHLTTLLSTSDHLYMPFTYKVTHIVNEQSSGHYVL
jgi:thiamine kinase-like enzyme